MHGEIFSGEHRILTPMLCAANAVLSISCAPDNRGVSLSVVVSPRQAIKKECIMRARQICETARKSALVLMFLAVKRSGTHGEMLDLRV